MPIAASLGSGGPWHDVWSCGQIQHLERQALPPPAPSQEPPRFSPGAPDTDFVGFHSREEDAEGTFRWTEPAALWRLALSPGDYRARLRLSLPPQDPRLRLSLNGHALRPAAGGSPETLAFGVSRAMLRPGGEQHLVLLSLPFRPQLLGSTDARTLGITVRFLDLVPVQVGSDKGNEGQPPRSISTLTDLPPVPRFCDVVRRNVGLHRPSAWRATSPGKQAYLPCFSGVRVLDGEGIAP